MILYALGTGETSLKFTYELFPDFAALPTYPNVLRHKGASEDIVDFVARVNQTKVMVPGTKDGVGVHGEQDFELFEEIPVDSKADFEMQTKVIGVFDAGKGMVQQLEYLLHRKETKRPVARWISTQFVIGAGGFGGPKRPKDIESETWKVPSSRAPDAVVEEQTTKDQAVIYRLSGDTNMLHIDPVYAKR